MKQALINLVSIGIFTMPFSYADGFVPISPIESKTIQTILQNSPLKKKMIINSLRTMGSVDEQIANKSCNGILKLIGNQLGLNIKTLSDLIPSMNESQQRYLRTVVLEEKHVSNFAIQLAEKKKPNFNSIQLVKVPEVLLGEQLKIEQNAEAFILKTLEASNLTEPVTLAISEFQYDSNDEYPTYHYEFSIKGSAQKIIDFKGTASNVLLSPEAAIEDFSKFIKDAAQNLSFLKAPDALYGETLRIGQSLKLLALQNQNQLIERVYKALDPIYFLKREKDGIQQNFVRLIVTHKLITNLLSEYESLINQSTIIETDAKLKSYFLQDINRTSDNPSTIEAFTFLLSEWDRGPHYQEELAIIRKYIKDNIGMNPSFYKAIQFNKTSKSQSAGSSSSSGIGIGEIIILSWFL